MENDNGKNGFKRLRLKGKTFVFIDWANVYGWTKSLKKEVDLEQLVFYLKTYQEIPDIRLYFGRDVHPKSVEFLERASHLGYTVIEKPVKYIFVEEIEQQKIYRRKCDFDMEVCIDVHQALKENIENFIFFTGDGDYEPLYKMLIALGKHVIVETSAKASFLFPEPVEGIKMLGNIMAFDFAQAITVGFAEVPVVYTAGHLGREIWNMKRGIFKVELENLIKI